MKSKFIEFEVWADEVCIAGYMALDEADDEAPLNFYDRDGFECGSNIEATKPIKLPTNEVEEHIDDVWEGLKYFFAEDCWVDLLQYLVDYADDQLKGREFHITTPWGMELDVELYINCSKLEPVVVDKDTTIRVKQSTKDLLSRLGRKGQSYDEIIVDLLRSVGVKNDDDSL